MKIVPKATDWDAYYAKPFAATTVTRRITTARLIGHMQRWLDCEHPVIAELGGANSCFVDALYQALQPKEYLAVDNNRYGLSLLGKRCAHLTGLTALEEDVLHPQHTAQADLVFSVGLIEHFDEAGTAAVIANHYRYVRPGGLVVISFPTPTFLYRGIRRLAELLGMWHFHDERPLDFSEVKASMEPHGELLASDLIWPIMLTQGLWIGRRGR
ncbi:MAG: class I SAM-dependent methyltransferase [Pseudomonadota bacterium]